MKIKKKMLEENGSSWQEKNWFLQKSWANSWNKVRMSSKIEQD